jgi:DNA-binding transcriptional LysR family regulator
MELTQLQVLVAVAEQGTLHKAAATLSRTSAAVRAAIDKLEEQVGTPLFEGSNGPELYLTEAGESLLDYAKRLLSLRDAALVDVERAGPARDCRQKSRSQAK